MKVIKVLPHGKIGRWKSCLCGGCFSRVNDIPVQSIARLNNEIRDEAPKIYTGLTNLTGYIGHRLTLSVAASGTGLLQYQWLFNDNPMAGMTNAATTCHPILTPAVTDQL